MGPHEHWHTDISYINIRGTFYYLCSVLDGFSRYIGHREIRQSMTEADVEIVLQGARKRFPSARPRIISDNGPQFIARDFKGFIGPERHGALAHEPVPSAVQRQAGALARDLEARLHPPAHAVDLAEARRIVAHFVRHYNNVRLHSAISYIAPKDKLEGRAEAILADRDRKLPAARAARKARRRERNLTERKEESKLPVARETEAGNAGERVRQG